MKHRYDLNPPDTDPYRAIREFEELLRYLNITTGETYGETSGGLKRILRQFWAKAYDAGYDEGLGDGEQAE